MGKVLKKIEYAELRLCKAKGYKYVARHEIGSMAVFKKKPIRKLGNHYGHWIIEDNFPIEKFHEYRNLEHGHYKSIEWKEEPLLIKDLLIDADIEGEDKSVLYIAYVKYQESEGYIHFIHGQGESILDLTADREIASYFESKDEILKELEYEAEPPYSIKFFKVVERISTEYIEEES